MEVTQVVEAVSGDVQQHYGYRYVPADGYAHLQTHISSNSPVPLSQTLLVRQPRSGSNNGVTFQATN